jgi:hypothetical protein
MRSKEKRFSFQNPFKRKIYFCLNCEELPIVVKYENGLPVCGTCSEELTELEDIGKQKLDFKKI